MDGGALGHQEHPRGAAVEPVDEARPAVSLSRLRPPPGAEEKDVPQGAIAVAGGGMGDEAGRLVHGEEVLVLVEDRERHLLRGVDPPRRERRKVQGDLVAQFQEARGARRGDAVDQDVPRRDPALEGVARQLRPVGEVAAEGAIQADAGVAAVGAEGTARAGLAVDPLAVDRIAVDRIAQAGPRAQGFGGRKSTSVVGPPSASISSVPARPSRACQRTWLG